MLSEREPLAEILILGEFPEHRGVLPGPGRGQEQGAEAVSQSGDNGRDIYDDCQDYEDQINALLKEKARLEKAIRDIRAKSEELAVLEICTAALSNSKVD